MMTITQARRFNRPAPSGVRDKKAPPRICHHACVWARSAGRLTAAGPNAFDNGTSHSHTAPLSCVRGAPLLGGDGRRR